MLRTDRTPLGVGNHASRHTPDHSFKINQKLDHVVALFMEQKQAIGHIQKKIFDIKKQLPTLSLEVDIVKTIIQSSERIGLPMRKKVPAECLVIYDISARIF